MLHENNRWGFLITTATLLFLYFLFLMWERDACGLQGKCRVTIMMSRGVYGPIVNEISNRDNEFNKEVVRRFW